MDMERKYPTREVDGVDVPQMGIKELIKQLGSALETMEGNRKSYTSPEEIEAGTLMVALFGNSLYYMRLFDKSLRTVRPIRSAGFAEVRKGRVTRGGGRRNLSEERFLLPPPALPHLIFQRLSTGGEAARRGAVVRLFVFSDRRKVSFAGSEENTSERHVKAWWGYGDIYLFYHDFYRNWTKSNSLWTEYEVNAAVGFHLST